MEPAAKEYADKLAATMEPVLASAIFECLVDRPEDPLTFVADKLLCSRPSQQQASCTAIASKPAGLTDHETLMKSPLSIVIFGATGDLARKKLFPALYQLCLLGHFPRNLNIVGYGRSDVDLKAFLEKQCVNIKEDSRLSKAAFTARVRFHAGGYDDPSSFIALHATLSSFEGGRRSNRLFFFVCAADYIRPSDSAHIAACTLPARLYATYDREAVRKGHGNV